MKIIKLLSILVAAVLATTACGGSSGELTIRDAWARSARIGGNGAAYFIIDNKTATNDTLLSVSSEIAAATEIHMSMGDDNGVMSMQMQKSIPVPARSQVEFKPGGLHVMFVSLTRNLQVGDTIIITLNFENAGAIVIEVPVQEP